MQAKLNTKFRNMSDISSIQPERLIKYRISEDKFAAEVLLPGVSYTDFDQKIGGKMNPWSIAKLFECLRYSVLLHGFGYFDRLKDDEHSMFMASSTYRVTDQGNLLNTRTHWGMNFPMYASIEIIYSGTSAFTFEVKVSDFNTGASLMSGYFTFVYVDFRTRKPALFPDWYNNVKSAKKFGPPLPRLPTPEIPQSVFQYEVCAYYSDIDQNGHVNQSVYVKWCTDAGTEAAVKGRYQGFTDNIGKYPLDTLEVKYIGEGMVEDNFVVNTWQDKQSPLVLYFAITKENKLTFVGRFKFRSSEYGARL